MAYVNWAHNMTTKGLRHLQMQKNAVCEVVQKVALVKHVRGKINSADILTKEERDTQYCIDV
eukprot:5966991-Ditylum_brightwellii.AAC.1